MNGLIKTVFTLIILIPGVNTGSALTSHVSSFRHEFLEDINHLRQKGCTCGAIYMPPAPPLTWNDQLEKAAANHAQDMFDQNYFNHTSKDGRNMEDRIVAAGYVFKGYQSFTIGENIAQGQQSVAQVMQSWIKSEGHCKNLMNPAFKEVGIAERSSLLGAGLWRQGAIFG